MNRLKKNRCALVLTLAFALFTLAAGAAQAGDEHRASLTLELEGSCQFTMVTINAVSCDIDDLATALEAGLDAAGLKAKNGLRNPFCGVVTATSEDDLECVWPMPDGCEQVSEAFELEPGTDCTGDTGLNGSIFRPVFIGQDLGFLTLEIHN